MMDAEAIHTFRRRFSLVGGSEHKVAARVGFERVVKVLDAHAIATESLFDYLTDHELANFLFGDDIEIEGFYEENGRLHLVVSQPWIDGPHPELPALKRGLEDEGLVSESPSGSTGIFIIPIEGLRDIHVIDIKPDNVILDEETGRIIPIDVHFYFDSHEERVKALEDLGLRSSPAE